MSEPGSPQGGERVGATRGARGDGGPEVTPVPLGDARVRRAPAAAAGPGRRLRALRLLPADLPDVHAVGRGDGLPARPDLPDEPGPVRRAADRLDGPALRRLPRLHGLRDRLPVRRAVRPADRGHPGAGRAPAPAAREGPAAARGDLRAVPVPAPAAAAARPAGARTSGPGCRRWSGAAACSPGWRRRWRRWRTSPRRSAGRARCRSGSRPGAPGGRRSACSPAACRARSSRRSTPPPRGCWRWRAATSSSPAGRAAAAR